MVLIMGAPFTFTWCKSKSSYILNNAVCSFYLFINRSEVITIVNMTNVSLVISDVEPKVC